jgi:alpha-glucosidase
MGAPDHGWGVEDAWLPWPPSSDSRNVADLLVDGGSILHLYRRLLAARRASAALRLGDFAWVDGFDAADAAGGGGMLAWRRSTGSESRIVAVNMGSGVAHVPIAGRVLVASDGGREGEPFDGTLAPDHAVLLAPA